tara:strand:- start:396 stop:1139 length:744 start_codon:yes stop_codon:yes gene_type:complete
MNNLGLWNKVEKTNPAHTKKLKFGRAITAIDPYRQIKNATEAFGPVGVGWGWSVERIEYLPTNELAVLIRMWHTKKENTFDQWGQASLYTDKAESKKDTDCFKKATTDGITKCLSFVGFNADVFLGKFEDNKYVQMISGEFSAAEAYQPALDKLMVRFDEGQSELCIFGYLDAVANKDQAMFEWVLNNIPKGKKTKVSAHRTAGQKLYFQYKDIFESGDDSAIDEAKSELSDQELSVINYKMKGQIK